MPQRTDRPEAWQLPQAGRAQRISLHAMNENLAFETIPLAGALRRREVSIAPLERVSLFAGLDRAGLAELARRARRQRFRERSVVVQEGSEASSLYVVVSGQVRIYASEDNRQITLGRRGPGEYFGEDALVDDGPHPATVTTLTAAELIVLAKEDVVEAIEGSPELALNVMRELGGRARLMVESLKALALKDVYGRLVLALRSVASPAEDQADFDLAPCERVTQQDIADMIGASRAMVGRILKDLVAGGYVTHEAGRLVIHKRLPSRW